MPWAQLAGHFHLAEKKGYAGVGLYTQKEPSDVSAGFGSKEFDAEGRYLEARYDTPKRKLSVISCYFPSGSSGEDRQAAKFRFLARAVPALDDAQGAARVHPGRRREHRAPGNRPEELEEQPEELRLPARRARLDEQAARCRRAGGRVPHAATRSPSNTPGGATAARPMPRTSAGVWTTTWPRRASRLRPSASTFTWHSASPTTRRSSSTMTSSSSRRAARLAPRVVAIRNHSHILVARCPCWSRRPCPHPPNPIRN